VLVHAGTEEVAKPKFEIRLAVEYELREDGIQSRDFPGFSRLRAAASSAGLKGSEIL